MKKITGIITFLLVIAGLIYLATTGPNKERIVEDTRFTMDTLVTIKAAGVETEAAIEAAFARIEEIVVLADRFDPNSEISRLNKQAGEGPVFLSKDLYEIIDKAFNYGREWQGVFSIAVAPLMDVWGFGNDRKFEIPPPLKLQELLTLVSLAGIHLYPEIMAVELAKGVSLDLGGVAKGFAVDEGLAELKKHRITAAYINAGGDIGVFGPKPDGKPWAIGVRDPRIENSKDYIKDHVIRVNGGSVVTSGDYERYFVDDGVRYHHIIDPRNGYPARGLRSVTIVGPSALVSDILATTIMILGRSEGLILLEGIEGYEGLLVSDEGEIFTSPGFLKHLGS